MATLEIAPRQLRPEVYELEGISRASVEAHYKLYQGYVNKRNEILGKLAEVDPTAANQVYSEIRALKVDLSFAVGGIKNHEFYFEHLGGHGGDPDGPVGELIRRDFGSVEAWRADLKATGMGGRGWAWTAYDWDERRLFNYIGDACEQILVGRFEHGHRRHRRRCGRRRQAGADVERYLHLLLCYGFVGSSGFE